MIAPPSRWRDIAMPLVVLIFTPLLSALSAFLVWQLQYSRTTQDATLAYKLQLLDRTTEDLSRFVTLHEFEVGRLIAAEKKCYATFAGRRRYRDLLAAERSNIISELAKSDSFAFQMAEQAEKLRPRVNADLVLVCAIFGPEARTAAQHAMVAFSDDRLRTVVDNAFASAKTPEHVATISEPSIVRILSEEAGRSINDMVRAMGREVVPEQ